MKQDTSLKKVRPACIGIAVLLTSACSQQASEPAAQSGKPSHIWSDQVETLHTAKDVANHVNEFQAAKDLRVRER